MFIKKKRYAIFAAGDFGMLLELKSPTRCGVSPIFVRDPEVNGASGDMGTEHLTTIARDAFPGLSDSAYAKLVSTLHGMPKSPTSLEIFVSLLVPTDNQFRWPHWLKLVAAERKELRSRTSKAGTRTGGDGQAGVAQSDVQARNSGVAVSRSALVLEGLGLEMAPSDATTVDMTWSPMCDMDCPAAASRCSSSSSVCLSAKQS